MSKIGTSVLPQKWERYEKLEAYKRRKQAEQQVINKKDDSNDSDEDRKDEIQTQYRWDSILGHSWMSTPKPQSDEEPPTWNGVGMRVRMAPNGEDEEYILHSIVVRNPCLMKVLRGTLNEYPGISMDRDELKLKAPFTPMLHRWDLFLESIREAQDEATETVAKFHDLLKDALKPSFKALRDADKHGVIGFDDLWTIFSPGELVWWDLKGHDSVAKIRETEIRETGGGRSSFEITCEQKDWNGVTLVSETNELSIKQFTGVRPIQDLAAVPLSRKLGRPEIEESVRIRGQEFLSLRGRCHRAYYLGIGKSKSIFSRWETVTGRILVDAASWHDTPCDRSKTDASNEAILSHSELLICSPMVKAFSFSKKQWYSLFVSSISGIDWNGSFGRLVLEDVQKELLLGLVETKLSNAAVFDDVIAGKGRGVIILLGGPPGVGKTLTAEAIADNLHSPLYTLSAGELGTSPQSVEKNLSRALELCSKWNAVLLLDEADMFLEARSHDNLLRNELVSIFLRHLEYFEGIMFLTSNRVDSLDTAFESRIDLKLHYKDLPESSRKSVWKNFVGKETNFSRHEDEDKLQELASYTLNGRQIKNIAKLSKMLALRKKEELDLEHLRSILRIYGFEQPETMDMGH